MNRILFVNTSDRGSGAEQVAWEFHEGMRGRGYDTSLLVGEKKSTDPSVITPYECPRVDYTPYQGWTSRFRLQAKRNWNRFFGREDFEHPYTRYLMELPEDPPDLVHCHNLHGGFFDLRELPKVSRQVPVVFTLHDTWLFTGHCANPIDCERWRMGCGNCPDLTLPPAILRDATATNWRVKASIYQESRFYIACPSRWLLERVQASILSPAIIEARHIPNGISCDIFRPAQEKSARDAFSILFIASRPRTNPFKDYPTLRKAILRVADSLPDRDIQLTVIGEEAPEEEYGRLVIRHLPPIESRRELAKQYQAADLYAHAARGENSPLTILEAMACGLPVVASEVGGIPEVVRPGETGLLAPPGDSEAMADAILQLAKSDDLRTSLGRQALAFVRENHDLNRVIDTYANWYESILTTNRKDH